jgi:hypothetical protein
MFHIWIISKLIRDFQHRAWRQDQAGDPAFGLIAQSFTVLLLSHAAQIHGWALTLWGLGAIPSYETSLYFSLVTYTTLGYGDVTLASDYRTFGGMASVTGVLAFGLSTALLVGLISRLFLAVDD